MDPQGAAVNMAAIVAQAAQHAIQNASATIAAQAHEAAIKAAQEARRRGVTPALHPSGVRAG